MSIFDLFSKRKARKNRTVEDVLVEGPLPHKLKTQIIHIWHETIGIPRAGYAGSVNSAYSGYSNIRRALLKEYGLFYLHGRHEGEVEDLLNWFLADANDQQALDLIELLFQFIQHKCDDFYQRREGTEMESHEAIAELNQRFLEKQYRFLF